MGFRGSSAGLSNGASAATRPSVPVWGCTMAPAGMWKTLKVLGNVDGSLITFLTLCCSIFVSVKQANAAVAQVLAGSL